MDLNRGKSHSQRQCTMRIPYHPHLEAEDRLHHLAYTAGTKTQERGLLLPDRTAPLAPGCRFDLGGVEKGMHVPGKEGPGCEDVDDPVEKLLQCGFCDGPYAAGYGIGTKRS